MSYSIEFLPSKEEIFQKGNDECEAKAEVYKKRGGIYVDPDFPPTKETLGVVRDIETGELDLEKLDNPWLPLHKFSNFTIYRHNNYGKYQIWNDPWPFHVCQGRLGDCWLIAAIMCIARKKLLLEELVPRNDYTVETGVVQVRLFVDEKWQVIQTDYHLPHIDKFERFAIMPKKQAWVAFIEKAYAKTRGTYGGLAGGYSDNAFTCLTGCMSRRIYVDKTTDMDKLWEDLNKWKADDFLLVASTPNQEDFSKEKRWYDRHMISDCHAYALLDFKVVDGHRLLHLGSNSTLKWNGKWSEKPGYDDEVLKKLSVQDRELSDRKTFWMEIDDFLAFFHRIYIGEYREGWSEIRVKQKVEKKAVDDVQVLRLDIIRRCGLAIEVTNCGKHTDKLNQFLNIHRSNPKNHLGELVHAAHIYDNQISTGTFHLDPGTYLVVHSKFGNQDKMENDWVIRSATPFGQFGSTIQCVLCPYTYLVNSVQEMFAKYGTAEKHEKDNVIIYTWHGEQTCFVMVDNLRKWEYVRVKCAIKSENKDKIKTHLSFGPLLSWPIPPMSRAIVAYYNQQEYGKPKPEMEIKYYISYRFLNLFNWCDYRSFGSDLEAATVLKEKVVTA
ncbi:unnamed protein product [Caenorhabditis brenneri]